MTLDRGAGCTPQGGGNSVLLTPLHRQTRSWLFRAWLVRKVNHLRRNIEVERRGRP